MFRFEMAWFTQEEFQDKLIARWPNKGNDDVQDFWKRIKKHIRTFGKGWGNNVRGQLRRDKQSLMEELKRIDAKAETETLNSAQWRDRYEKKGP
jgi:hypothetical protein